MKGIIVLSVKEFIISKFDEEKWKEILRKSDVNDEPLLLPAISIKDEIVKQIFNSICKVLNLTMKELANIWGDYWINVYTKKTYSIFYARSKNVKDFLLKLNDLHKSMTHNLPDAQPPEFLFEHIDKDTLVITYKSHRNLLDFAIGAIYGLGKYYNEKLEVIKLSDNKIKVKFISYQD